MKENNTIKEFAQLDAPPMRDSQNEESIKRLLAQIPEVGEVRLLSGRAVGGLIPEDGAIVCVAASLQKSESLRDEEGVMAWETVYDAAYAAARDSRPNAENYKVWKSAISGESIPEEEMRAWQQGTVKRIKALGPKRILEIGCGHGLLLFPLLAEVERYAGTELSNEALDWLSQGLAGLPDKEKSKISLRHAEAATPLGPTDESFDLAIYNSVIQYFPSREYLQSALERIMPHLDRNALIFLGDIRNFALAPLEHLARLLYQSPSLEATKAWAAIRQRVNDESELLLAPGYWHNLSGLFDRIRAVAALPKAGDYENELSMFRYDVLLQLDSQENRISCPSCMEWNTGPVACAKSLDKHLADWKIQGSIKGEQACALTSVPNAQISALRLIRERLEDAGPGMNLADLKEWADAMLRENAALRGLKPSELREGARRHGLDVALSISPGQSHTLDAVFFVPGAATFSPSLEGSFPEIHAVFKKAMLARQANKPMLDAPAPELQNLIQTLLDSNQAPGRFVGAVLPREPGDLSAEPDQELLALEAGLLLAGGAMFSRPEPGTETLLARVWARLARCDLASAWDSFHIFPERKLASIRTWLEAVQGEQLPTDLMRVFPSIRALGTALSLKEDGKPGKTPALPRPDGQLFPFISN